MIGDPVHRVRVDPHSVHRSRDLGDGHRSQRAALAKSSLIIRRIRLEEGWLPLTITARNAEETGPLKRPERRRDRNVEETGPPK
jgi:hypothetical protein